MLTRPRAFERQRTSVKTLCSSFLFFAVSTQVAVAAERALSGAEITAALSDQTLVDVDATKNIEQVFQKSGLTHYIENGALSQGKWKVDGDKYCSVWPPSEIWSCYAVTQDDKLVTFISTWGKRYPMLVKESAK
jgi:hypothetical protein